MLAMRVISIFNLVIMLILMLGNVKTQNDNERLTEVSEKIYKLAREHKAQSDSFRKYAFLYKERYEESMRKSEVFVKQRDSLLSGHRINLQDRYPIDTFVAELSRLNR
jgi:hypothetical protein